MIPLLLAMSCLPVDGPKLLAKHFVAASPEFAKLAPETDLGHGPLPGVVRTFRPDELARIGERHGLVISANDDFCFAWEMGPLDPAKVVDAMRSALPAEARLEVLEVSRAAVPPGDLHFPLHLLKQNIWRGYVRYAQDRRHEIWARVRVGVAQDRVVVAEPLKIGERIRADQLRVDRVEVAPESGYVARLEDAVGLVAKRPLAAGTALTTRMLDKPSAIERGDTVRLRANTGAAQITIDVHAIAAGKIGEVIAVKNPSSGRVLRARIEKAGEVTLAQ